MTPRERLATLENGSVVLKPLSNTTILEFILRELPPSDNELYFTRGQGHRQKRILTDVGRSFKNGIKDSLTAIHQAAGMPLITRAMMLRIEVQCRIPHLFTRTAKAENWFRIVDAHNRGKVLIDAVTEHFGIQDAQSFSTLLEKCEGEPSVHVTLSTMTAQPAWPEGC